MWNRKGERRNSCLASNFRRKAFSISPLSVLTLADTLKRLQEVPFCSWFVRAVLVLVTNGCWIFASVFATCSQALSGLSSLCVSVASYIDPFPGGHQICISDINTIP